MAWNLMTALYMGHHLPWTSIRSSFIPLLMPDETVHVARV